MNLVKKIISCGLALSLALGGIGGALQVSAENGSLSTEQKIAGGISAGVGTGLLASILIGAAWHHYHKLPVLIIGGDDATRTKLIDKLKNPEPLINPRAGDMTLTSAIEKKTAEGVKANASPEHRVEGTGETRAQFKNWNISQCDASDAKAADLMKKARLVIVLLKDANDLETIPTLISNNAKGNSCMVAGVIDFDLLRVRVLAQKQKMSPEAIKLCSIGFMWNSSRDTFYWFRNAPLEIGY